MFTGIIQGTAVITHIQDQENLRTITLDFRDDFCTDLRLGSSVAVDGVCLTVTTLLSAQRVEFDIMLPTLQTTTLGNAMVGMYLNVERAAKAGAENGGHALSGHIDCCGRVVNIQQPKNNYVLTIELPSTWMRYLFNKGYIALNGTSLTITQVRHDENVFEIWLIPETLRQTTFVEKKINDLINVEIDRSTQVIVDTLRLAIAEQFKLLHLNGDRLSLCVV
jgi:riboflavin synthase